MTARRIVLLVNLLQDVNIVRPLAYLAAAETDCTILILTSNRFYDRDGQGLWTKELKSIARDVGATIKTYDSTFVAIRALTGGRGVIFAASESSLPAHSLTHDVFRAAPPAYLRVTLQHGYECVGFLQNADHDKAYGRNVRFAADVLAGWAEMRAQVSIPLAERAKYYLSGPSALLDAPDVRAQLPNPPEGLVCENMHSARFTISGDFRDEFMDAFRAFSLALGSARKTVALRPHPGGQFAVKSGAALGANVKLANQPAYKLAFSQFAYAISPPSSVLIDLILAGVPTAVWQDADGTMDAGNYRGLSEVSLPGEWLDFRQAALGDKRAIVKKQERFLRDAAILTDRQTVKGRFARLMSGGENTIVASSRPRRRILFVANGLLPTLQLSFLKPLAPLVEAGVLEIRLLTEADLKVRFKGSHRGDAAAAWMQAEIRSFAPETVIFCRYSGPHSQKMLETAQDMGASSILHIDDDLLNVPIEIGVEKFKVHNAPERLASVRALLSGASLVYCSTQPLIDRFRSQGFNNDMRCGAIYCAAEILEPATLRPVTKIGYMGFDHAHDLELVLPALVEVLHQNPETRFELFGSIPKPPVLDQFGDRITTVPPVRNYGDFMHAFADLQWDIGICPLADTPFNKVKANTKWVEYSSVGAAVVASIDTVYDDCCSDGCGALAGSTDEWIEMLNALCQDPDARYQQVRRAQARLMAQYSDDVLRKQVIDMIATSHELSTAPVSPTATSGPTTMK